MMQFISTTEGLIYEPDLGSRLEKCIEVCCRMAKNCGQNVMIRNFNGKSFVITPASSEAEVYDSYMDSLRREQEEYNNSPEGKAAIRETEERIRVAQNKVDLLLKNLANYQKPSVDDMVRWVAEFAEYADRGTNFDHDYVIGKLESFGYYNNAHVTGDRESAKNWDRKTMGEYILGQAISCLRHGLPPHPSLTQKFTEEYFDAKEV